MRSSAKLHLEPTANMQPSDADIDLVSYLAEFDLTLSDLRPDQTGMFVAARNAASYVEDMEIPVASGRRGRDEAELSEKETDSVLEETVYANERLESTMPTDEMDVGLIRGSEDLPRILPTQWMLEDVSPPLFYAKLAQRELLMPQWECPTRRPEHGFGEITDRELIGRQATTDSTKQHAYLLLDTSRTMRDHDRRGIVARGLALAFLLHGHAQRARLNVRPFTAEVGELSSGASRDDFRAIVRRVIELPNSGQTRIQNALDQAVADIRDAGPCLRADIMLISDGISRLAECPLDGEVLHTFIVGDLFHQQESAGTLETLKGWSKTFRRVWKNRFAELLAPTEQDLEAAGRQLQELLAQLDVNPTPQDAARAKQTLENVKFLVRELKRIRGKKAPPLPQVESLESELSDAEDRLATVSAGWPTGANQHAASPDRWAAPGMVMASSSDTSSNDSTGLWTRFQRLFSLAWALLRRLIGRPPRPSQPDGPPSSTTS